MGHLSWNRESFIPTCRRSKKEAWRRKAKAWAHSSGTMRATCAAAAAALKKANKGQPFFAQAQYFFSLDSRSAEMQGAVAALLAGIVTAVVAAARAPLRLAERREAQRRRAGAQWRLSKGLKGEPLKFARAFQSPSDCSSLAASFFTAASVVLRARTNTDRVTQISLEMVLLLVILRCCTAAWQRRRRQCCYCQICQWQTAFLSFLPLRLYYFDGFIS